MYSSIDVFPDVIYIVTVLKNFSQRLKQRNKQLEIGSFVFEQFQGTLLEEKLQGSHTLDHPVPAEDSNQVVHNLKSLFVLVTDRHLDNACYVLANQSPELRLDNHEQMDLF
jgi:hypothetical protein